MTCLFKRMKQENNRLCIICTKKVLFYNIYVSDTDRFVLGHYIYITVVLSKNSVKTTEGDRVSHLRGFMRKGAWTMP